MSNIRTENNMTKPDLGQCKVIKVSDIKVSPFNVRDQEVEPVTSEKFQELCDSIKTDGIIEPLVVRPSRRRRIRDNSRN